MVWRWASASEIGTSHLRLGTRKQDAMTAFLAGDSRDAMCVVVCDGAGSAEHGGEGASVICRTMAENLRRHLTLAGTPLPTDDDIWSWVDLARDRLSLAAERRDKTRRAFASTLVMLVASGDTVLTAHVGDGAIVGRSGDDWVTLSAPENGEYASMTYFVTDDPAPQLRITRVTGTYSGFAVFSDGIENLALDHRTNDPHAPFFRTMLTPLDGSEAAGRDVKLSVALAAFLASPRVCDKTDDDKSLVLISGR